MNCKSRFLNTQYSQAVRGVPDGSGNEAVGALKRHHHPASRELLLPRGSNQHEEHEAHAHDYPQLQHW